MLMTIGQGVVLNALLGIGFECTQYDFDLARLQKVEQPYLIKLDVTSSLVGQDSCAAIEPAPPVGLTSTLSWLHHQLSKVNCHFDAQAFRRDSNEATFVRHDLIKSPRQDSLIGTRVIVRARVERVEVAASRRGDRERSA